VYCSAFIDDETAEREFRAKNPKVGPTRIVRFVSGCHRRAWVKNVVAIGNATGFVEPLEATALGVIAIQSWTLADVLRETGRRPTPSQVAAFNQYHIRNWSAIRSFIALHYKFNTRLDTPFWRECREKTDLAGAEPVVDYYRENGPTSLLKDMVLDPVDQFGVGGYHALLLGMNVPHDRPHTPTDREAAAWAARRQRFDEVAGRGMTVREALDVIRSPRWQWTAPAGRANSL
jgi:tryptophan halogenase